MTVLQAVRRTYLPHLALGPTVFVWRTASEWDPPPPDWIPWSTGIAAVAALVGAWVVSGLTVGKVITPFRLPLDRTRIWEWWTEMTTPRPRRRTDDDATCLGTLVMGAAGMLVLVGLSLLRQLWASPFWFSLFCQGVDLVLLTLALWRGEALTAVREQTAASEADRKTRDDRAAAIHAVRSYYDEHLALIADDYPPVRLHTELRVRVPESARPDDAWSVARALLSELHELVARATRREKEKLAAALPGTPLRNEAAELRTRLALLEAQIAQTEEEIARSQERDENPAWLERQLAELHRRQKELIAELERLVPIPTPDSDSGG